MRQTEDVTAAVLSNFYESLVDLDGQLSLTPHLALQWTNPTERTWHFTLRPGVLFHDGSPFGAADVVASLERAQRLPDGKLAADLRAATARALDDRTVELVTDRPRPLLLVRLAALAILPRGTSDAEVLRPVGTGPYRFLSAGEGRKVIQGERWERYWGRAPDAARFTIEALQEDARNLSSADVVSPLPPAGPSGAAADVSPASSGLRVVVHPTVMTAFLVCDVRPGSPFATLEARRALSGALDREALVKVARNASPASQLVARGINGYEPAIGRPRPAPRDVRGKPIEAELLVSPASEAAGREIARQAAAAGFRLSVVALPWTERYARMRAGRAALSLAFWTAGTGDASSLFEPLLHTAGGPEGFGSENTSGYSNPELDAELARAATEMSPSARAELLRSAMRRAMTDLPLIPLYNVSERLGLRPGLELTPRLDRAVRVSEIRIRPAS
ncbi:MAG: hypothetical protein JNK60_20685, partial [Acidobacteria bacterium]|nr:hypothetical protein [Acidobacteriota bacterium]